VRETKKWFRAQTQMLGELQHAHKRCLERLLVGSAKRADRLQKHRGLAVQVDSAGQQDERAYQ